MAKKRHSRILVVEDEKITALDICRRLQNLGYEVVADVSSGEEAVAKTAEMSPDLVLMDIVLKGVIDGVQAADEIRRRFNIPVVFLTAFTDDLTLQRAKTTEAFGYILKPFEGRELHTTIEMALYKHQMEKRLQESERRFATTLSSIGDAVVATDVRGFVSFMNSVAEGLTGWTVEEAAGRDFSATFILIAEDSGDVCESPVTRAMREKSGAGVAGNALLIAKTGRRIHVDLSAAPIRDDRGTVDGVVVVFRDRTDQRKAEDTLRKLSRAVEQSPVSVVITDPRGIIEYVNPRFTQATGYASAEAVGQGPGILISDEVLGEGEGASWDAILSGKEWRGEFSARKKDGTLYWEFASFSPILDDHGRIMHILAVKEDVTERKRVEEALRESEDKYRTIFETTTTAIIIINEDASIALANTEFAKLAGYPKEEIQGKMAWTAFIADEDVERMNEYRQEHLFKPDGLAGRYEFRLRDRAGQKRNILARMAAIPGTKQIVASFSDITDMRMLEEHLIQAQKMDAVGTLVGGIAHDYNNILNNIVGFAHQLTKYTGDPVKVLKYGESIAKSAQRGAELAVQLLSFVRQRKREDLPTGLGGVIEEVVALCRETFPKNISLEEKIDPQLLPVMGNRGELYQALLNICLNARDAMPYGGTILIEVRQRRSLANINPRLVIPTDTPEREYVEVIVIDNGSGIPENIRGKIFDPFFTTKERGRGTGLGLSVVYNILRNHAGSLMVESEVGRGTAIHMFLPALCVTQAEPSQERRAAPSQRGSELILLVDDEEPMQELGRELLEEYGYRVLIARDGLEAIDTYRRHVKDIALVVLDLVMPRMDGGHAYLELKKINPDVKVFFCTGYTPDELITSLFQEENLRALQKPFQPAAFLEAVRETLAR